VTIKQAIQVNIRLAAGELASGRRMTAREAALRAACEARRLGLAQELARAVSIYQSAASLDEVRL
jgi:hypothetical protein